MKRNLTIIMIGLIGMISPISSSAQNKAKDKKKDSAKKEIKIAKPELKTPGDTIAYLYGAIQAGGLKDFVIKQYDVDTAYLDEFYRGLQERTSVDPNDKKRHAYDVGVSIGNQLENMAASVSKDYYETEEEKGKKIDLRIVGASVLQGLFGQNDYNAKTAGPIFEKAMNDKKEANLAVTYGANRIAGEKWLEENKKKEGVVTLPSGLQYKVLTQGTGDIPKATDKVSVNYEGHLIDGTVFDSSYERKEPTSFRCNQVIKGWTEALTMMPVGSKWEIYIPQELAYGSRNTGKIKPFSALIFTVELLEIEQTPAKTTTTAKTATTKKANSK